MKHLYYIRHGLSEDNKAGVWSGSRNTPLSNEGHEQAKLAGEKAKKQGIVFDVVLSSPLQRAHHTAQHVSKAVNYPIEKIVLHPDLVERNFGILEGGADAEAKEKYRRHETLIDEYENVEKMMDLQWRAQKMLEYLHTLPHDTVLVVGHGAFGRALKRAIDKETIHAKIEPLKNADIVKLI